MELRNSYRNRPHITEVCIFLVHWVKGFPPEYTKQMGNVGSRWPVIYIQPTDDVITWKHFNTLLAICEGTPLAIVDIDGCLWGDSTWPLLALLALCEGNPLITVVGFTSSQRTRMTSWHGHPFFITALLCNESTRPVDSLHKRPVMRCFDVFFIVSLNILLNNKSNSQLFETPCFFMWH